MSKELVGVYYSSQARWVLDLDKDLNYDYTNFDYYL